MSTGLSKYMALSSTWNYKASFHRFRKTLQTRFELANAQKEIRSSLNCQIDPSLDNKRKRSLRIQHVPYQPTEQKRKVSQSLWGMENQQEKKKFNPEKLADAIVINELLTIDQVTCLFDWILIFYLQKSYTYHCAMNQDWLLISKEFI